MTLFDIALVVIAVGLAVKAAFNLGFSKGFKLGGNYVFDLLDEEIKKKQNEKS